MIEGSNNPEWERWAYLVHSDSQSEHRISIRLILPSGAGSHMIRSVIIELDVFLLHRATAYVYTKFDGLLLDCARAFLRQGATILS